MALQQLINVVDAINDSYWKATAGGNTVGTVGVGNVKPGNKVTFSAGDNLKSNTKS